MKLSTKFSFLNKIKPQKIQTFIKKLSTSIILILKFLLAFFFIGFIFYLIYFIFTDQISLADSSKISFSMIFNKGNKQANITLSNKIRSNRFLNDEFFDDYEGIFSSLFRAIYYLIDFFWPILKYPVGLIVFIGKWILINGMIGIGICFTILIIGDIVY